MKSHQNTILPLMLALASGHFPPISSPLRMGRERDTVSASLQAELKEKAQAKRERKGMKRIYDDAKCRTHNRCLRGTGKNWMTAK